MNISGICNLYFPDRLERVTAAYDGSDLQTFLDSYAQWRGVPVTAAEILAKEAEYDAAILAAANQAAADALDVSNTRADTLIQQFIGMTPAQITSTINSKTTVDELKPIIIRMAKLLWLLARTQN